MNVSFRTNESKLNVPAKVLTGSITASSVYNYWLYPNQSDDQWWSLGSNPRGYQYEITITLSEQNHGSNLTRVPYKYNGMDVKVGDWLGYTDDGTVLKIVSVTSKNNTSVTVIAEDYQRYNTFKSSSGNPLGSGTSVVIFECQESGLAQLDPLPTGPGSKFINNVNSRFIRQNIRDNFELYVENNSFTKGDILAAYNGNLIVSNSTQTATNMVGIVTMDGPGPDYVSVEPKTKFVDYDLSIPTGNVGQSIFVTTNGKLTTGVANATSVAAYIIVQEAQPTVLTGSVNDPVFATSAFNIELNEETIAFTGTENLSQIVTKINNTTANSEVIASSPTEENVAASGTLSLAYGLVGGFVPFSASINGVAVTFASDYYGNLRYGAPVAGPEDMKIAIDNANIPNLEVWAPGDGTITLTELNGNAITIVNTSTDNTGTGGAGVGFAGTNSATGIPLTNNAKVSTRLRLTRNNGGPIDINDSSLYFENTIGIASGQTGRPVVAAYVYEGLGTASTSVVANIAARDALSPSIGDMAYVINDGTGSYALYLWQGSSWKQLATEESAYVDARTYEIDYSVGGNTSILLGNVSVDRKIESVSAEVTVAFDDANANVFVGTVADPDLLFDSNDSDLDVVATYLVKPEFYTTDPSGQDQQYYATIDPQGATVGNVTVKITYI